MNYSLIRTKRKTIAIKLSDNGEIVVRAPLHLSKAYIDKVISEKQSWIEKARMNLSAAGLQNSIVYGSPVLFMGSEYRLEQAYSKSSKAIEISGDTIFVYAKSGESAAEAYERALYTSAAEYLPQRLSELSAVFSDEECRIRISKAKARWGSCSKGSGRMPVIALSLRLMQLPPECIDAVIIHELCHLTVSGHGKDFYALMQARNPNWRDDYAKEKKNARRCMSWQA